MTTYRTEDFTGTLAATATAPQLGLTSVTGTPTYVSFGYESSVTCVEYGPGESGTLVAAFASVLFEERVLWVAAPPPAACQFWRFNVAGGTAGVSLRMLTTGQIEAVSPAPSTGGSDVSTDTYADARFYKIVPEVNQLTSVATFRIYDRLDNLLETLTVWVGPTALVELVEGVLTPAVTWSVRFSRSTIRTEPIVVATGQPNIVYIVLDDASENLWRHMSEVVDMANNGLTFSSFYAATPLCGPDRAAMMSGQHPHNSGVLTNKAFHEWRSDPTLDATSAMVRMRDAGSHVAFLGKMLNGLNPEGDVDAPALWVPPGCDWAFMTGGGAYAEFDWKATLQRDDAPVLIDTSGGQPLEGDYLTDVISGHALDFIDDHAATRAGQPFLLWLAPYATHNNIGAADPEDPNGPGFPPAPRDRVDTPNRPGIWNPAEFPATGDLGVQTPIPWPDPPGVGNWNLFPTNAPGWFDSNGNLSNSQLDRYYEHHLDRIRMLQSVNDMIAAIRAKLSTLGLLDNTFIIVTSDNGYHLGEHGLNSSKGTPYDHDIRLPLVILPPGGTAPRTITAMTQPVDLVNTFLTIAGLEEDLTLDGRSFLPFIEGSTPTSWRQTALVGYVVEDGTWQTALGTGFPPDYWALRSPDGMYTSYDRAATTAPPVDRGEAYNLNADPWEMDNLWAGVSDVKKEDLHALLRRLMTTAGEEHWLAARSGFTVSGTSGVSATALMDLELGPSLLSPLSGEWKLLWPTSIDDIAAPSVVSEIPAITRPDPNERGNNNVFGEALMKIVMLITDNIPGSGIPGGMAQFLDNKDALRSLLTAQMQMLGLRLGGTLIRERLVELASSVSFVPLGNLAAECTFLLRAPAGPWQVPEYSTWSDTIANDKEGLWVTPCNGATAVITDAVIRVSGPLNSIKITDDETGAWMSWEIEDQTPAITAGQWVIFDLQRLDASVVDEDTWGLGQGTRHTKDLDWGSPLHLAKFALPLTPGRAKKDPYDRRVNISVDQSGATASTLLEIRIRGGYR